MNNSIWQICPLCQGNKNLPKKCEICNGTGLISVITGKPPMSGNEEKIQEINKNTKRLLHD